MVSMDHTPAGIGDRLKMLRSFLGLSQAEFAAGIELTQAAVSAWENGERMLPIEAARTIKSVHDVSLDWLYDADARALPYAMLAHIKSGRGKTTTL